MGNNSKRNMLKKVYVGLINTYKHILFFCKFINYFGDIAIIIFIMK